MDLLACPIDKSFPLELTVLEEKTGGKAQTDKVPCEIYCGWKSTMLKNPPADWVLNCRECLGINIETAVLLCRQCGRWYPVLGRIPRMLPDELRSAKSDEDFLNQYKERLPTDVVKRGVVGKAKD